MKPTPEEWSSLASKLSSIYENDRKSAAWQLRQHRYFMEVPDETFDLVSVHRVIHMHREGNPTEGPRSGQSLEDHRLSLAQAGYREITENEPEFETFWERYLDLCKTVHTSPSGGQKKPPRARAFFARISERTQPPLIGNNAYSPDDLPADQDGSVSQVTRNVYERKRQNRCACIAHHLTDTGRILCAVCGIDFEEQFGDIGHGFIHVHHVHPLGERQPPDDFDPTVHLKPVCPNCHAMIHRGGTTRSLDILRDILRNRR